MHFLGKSVVLALLLVTSLAMGQDSRLSVKGFVSFKLFDSNGQESWLTGGGGKLPAGGDDGELGLGRVHLSATWEPNLYFQAHVHGIGRLDPDEYEGDAFGITEAFVQARAFAGDRDRFRFRLGFFFPPTSMENIDDLWVSPFTLSLSALNSWVGEEVRWTGLDVAYTHEFSEERVFFAGGTLFGGNDSVGALLAWRGWALGERLSVYDEVLPLPDLQELSQNGFFGLQRDDGTLPFSEDLDGRPGYALRLGLDLAGDVVVQLNHSDNQGDRQLYRGEYAWDMTFWSAGFQWLPDDYWHFAGEYLDGESGMGDPAGPHVQFDMETWYLLTSAAYGSWRGTVRYDDFSLVDRDRFAVPVNVGPNDEEGDALTVALFWVPHPSWRFGLEWLTLDAVRKLVLTQGNATVVGGDLWSLEARYIF